jgi:DNA repair protein RecO (recombination protein O)
LGTDTETDALVLSFTDVGEADRIVSFLSREHGLLRAGVSGARGLGKGRAAAFDLFALVRVVLHVSSKPGRLARIRGASVLDPHLELRNDYPRLCAASYIAETVARSAQEGDPAPAVTDLVLLCLERLSRGKPPAGILLLFEARFLKEMGWVPQLNHCLSCGKEIGPQIVFSAALGGVVHPSCPGGRGEPRLTPADLGALRFLTGKTLRGAANLSLDEEQAADLFRLLHPFTRHHSGFEPRAAKSLTAVLLTETGRWGQSSPRR